jgi:hypothetical protein
MRFLRPGRPLVVARDLRIERGSDARITARAIAVRFLAATRMARANVWGTNYRWYCPLVSCEREEQLSR